MHRMIILLKPIWLIDSGAYIHYLGRSMPGVKALIFSLCQVNDA